MNFLHFLFFAEIYRFLWILYIVDNFQFMWIVWIKKEPGNFSEFLRSLFLYQLLYQSSYGHNIRIGCRQDPDSFCTVDRIYDLPISHIDSYMAII